MELSGNRLPISNVKDGGQEEKETCEEWGQACDIAILLVSHSLMRRRCGHDD